MSRIGKLRRREALALAGGGLVLGLHVGAASGWPAFAGGAGFAPNLFVAVAADGRVTITVSRAEMGSGIRTTLAAALAEEMDADWADVRVVQAPADARYGDQRTEGSCSLRLLLPVMREAGAAARAMLLAAAAQRWGIAQAACTTAPGVVLDPATGRRLGYGELAAAAARLPVPPAAALRLKPPAKWRYLGRNLPGIDLDDIVHGGARYGIDVVRPGMKHAAIARPPVYGGRVRSFDATAALAVPGVERVVELPAPGLPSGFRPLGGIAVIAADTWTAQQGRRRLRIDWDDGPNAGYDSTEARAVLAAAAARPGRVVRAQGDVDAVLAGAARRVAADYFVPHIAHATMEPEAAVAEVADGRCTVWTATQDPQATQATVAEVLGSRVADVTVQVTLLGGGFGRKSKPDYAAEAALLARAAGAPVKVTWSREDSIAHDYYHAVSVQHLEAGLDSAGRVQAWLHRSAFPSIASSFEHGARHGQAGRWAAGTAAWLQRHLLSPLGLAVLPDTRYAAAGELAQGVTDLPFAIPNLRCENGPAEAGVRIGWYRSVCHIQHAFAVGCFVDELAAAAGRDPVAFLLDLLGPPRRLDLAAQGVAEPQAVAEVPGYPVDIGRMRQIVELAAERAGWTEPLPPRHGRGIAVHRSFLTYVAAVARVAVAADGTVRVLRLDLAVDCGLVVNPDRVAAQFEGAAVMALGNALLSRVTFRAGRAEQDNFNDFRIPRLADAPETHVHVVPSEAPPAAWGSRGCRRWHRRPAMRSSARPASVSARCRSIPPCCARPEAAPGGRMTADERAGGAAGPRQSGRERDHCDIAQKMSEFLHEL